MEESDPERRLGCVSLRSDSSMVQPIKFTEEQTTEDSRMAEESEAEASLTSMSLKSGCSRVQPINFTGEQSAAVSGKELSHEDLHPDKQMSTVFKQLEENIINFVKEELKMFYMNVHGPKLSQREDGKEKSREAFLKITLDFLREMKQDELAENLKKSFNYGASQHELQFLLQQKYQSLSEGIAKAGNSTPLNQIYTELYIAEGDVTEEHEIRRIEGSFRRQATQEVTIACEDIFKVCAKRDKSTTTEVTSAVDKQSQTRTVLTMGVAGIGKTVLTQKFCLDWAEGKANQDVHLVFPFTFRELNVLRDRKISLAELVRHFYSNSINLCSSENVQTLFIFDGLDECRFSLDFTQTLRDPSESSSVGAVLVNLIKGSLLPFARVWITTRPAAASQIPAQCISIVTEVRGFADPQKEQYFKKRFKEEQEATAVIAHIKKSRSLYAMCRIPVFSWITSTVLDHVMKTGKTDQKLPNTLTEMYIQFLVVQAKLKNMKYDEKSEIDPVWSSENQKMVRSLSKLAFEQLQKGNLIFYESDLVACGLDVKAASMYSGVFTQIFREEPGLYQDKVFSFVHLSVQEFLAALHVHVTFVNTGNNLLKIQGVMHNMKIWLTRNHDLNYLHLTAVEKALENPNGHWDLFLRFLLGLSCKNNERLIMGLLRRSIRDDFDIYFRQSCHYIKSRMLDGTLSAEMTFNLFHCLSELGEPSLVESIQETVREGSFSKIKSSALWSVVAFLLLSSDKDLSVFDLKKYCASEEVFFRLQPLVQEANTAILTASNLSKKSCHILSSILSSQNSLRFLDLSNNNICDSGVEQLCLGLISPECRLETLRLSGCLVTEEGGTFLVSALSSTASCLKELDLSYNHIGNVATEKLSALQKDPCYSLELLRVDPAGEKWLIPGLKKYLCKLTLDPNSAHRKLKLSEDNRTVTFQSKDCPYPDHLDRFDSCRQVLCSTELRGRCYWEVEWTGSCNNWEVDVAVSNSSSGRKGSSGFGLNDKSWCLKISSAGFSVLHEGIQTPVSSSYSFGDRVTVYLDYPAGTLTFYKIKDNDGEAHHLHTFSTTFTEPLYAGFGFGLWSSGVLVSLDRLPTKIHYYF